MNVIENFAELSFEEQRKFAEALVKTINSEHTFTDEFDFKISSEEADDFTGGLVILIEHDGLIEVSREATWQCATEDDVADDPGYSADYANFLVDDVKKVFKTLSTEIEGYKVSLEVDDADEEETVEVNVDNYTHEDAGIGDYEYGGYRGHDSRPYIEVEGTIVRGCDCALSLYVELVEEPAEEPTIEPDEEV